MYRKYYCHFGYTWMLLVVLALVISSCSSTTTLTKKQRNAIDRYVDQTADAIHFSASKVKKMLVDYKLKNGTWPKTENANKEIFQNIDNVLEQHHIDDQKLVEVDSNEVIVEYSFSNKKFKQFPEILESWVIVFNQQESDKLEIVSIFPHWSDAKTVANKSSYSYEKIEQLRDIFQKQLKDRLTSYSISLSEHINDTL